MQEDLLQPNMTVLQNMKIAAHLKLGTTVTPAEKRRKVKKKFHVRTSETLICGLPRPFFSKLSNF